MKQLTIFPNKKLEFLLSEQFIFGAYLLLRFLFGYNYFLIYGLVFAFLITRVSVEKIALYFSLLAVIFYIFEQITEANHYFSFVFGFVFLFLLKEIKALFTNRNAKKS